MKDGKENTSDNFWFYDKKMADSLLKGSESTVDEIKAFIEKYGD